MLKTILVHVDETAASEERIRAALMLAERHEGHVTGLHVMAPQDHLPWADGYALELMLKEAADRARADAAVAEAQFSRLTAGHAVVHEWRLVEGPVDKTVTRHARTVDLVVVGQIDGRNPPLGSAAFVPETVVLGAGRPVLIVPFAGPIAGIGNRVLVAWDGGREAARAVNDALPILRHAEQVTIVSVSKAKGEAYDAGATDLATHLTRHGVRVTVRRDVASGIGIGDLLLSLAADLGIDLMVMGGYGHSRMRELVLGGATRTLLEEMTVPVLMSH